MGTVLDTTVFIAAERASRGRRDDLHALIGERLAAALGPDDEVAIASITASELLHGVHRASPSHRGPREAFVEAVLSVVPVLDFDLLAARAHARLWAHLARAGSKVGAHDRLVAATAISVGWRVGAAHTRHFRRIPGLTAIELTWAR